MIFMKAAKFCTHMFLHKRVIDELGGICYVGQVSSPILEKGLW